MSLLASLVDRIFERLALVYGRDFTDRYAGLSPLAVKAEWARELQPFAAKPKSIAFALDNLPPAKPPTVLEFRAICNRAPEMFVPQLPQPRTDDERVRKLLAVAKDAVGAQQMGPRARAERLLARAEAGELTLTQTQREWIRGVFARKRDEWA